MPNDGNYGWAEAVPVVMLPELVFDAAEGMPTRVGSGSADGVRAIMQPEMAFDRRPAAGTPPSVAVQGVAPLADSLAGVLAAYDADRRRLLLADFLSELRRGLAARGLAFPDTPL